jgi:hypothetical protein
VNQQSERSGIPNRVSASSRWYHSGAWKRGKHVIPVHGYSGDKVAVLIFALIGLATLKVR